MGFTCPHCSRFYTTKGWYESHVKKCKKNPTNKKNPPNKKTRKKKSKKNIPPELRARVWNTYIGQQTKAKCFCCWKNTITPFSGWKTFQAGHIISESNEGIVSLNNLLPICRDCNGLAAMGTENWDEYVKRNIYPLRIYGANPPERVIWATTYIQSMARMWKIKKIEKVIWATIIIQSLVRMWIERKNPTSAWKLEWMRRTFI